MPEDWVRKAEDERCTHGAPLHSEEQLHDMTYSPKQTRHSISTSNYSWLAAMLLAAALPTAAASQEPAESSAPDLDQPVIADEDDPLKVLRARMKPIQAISIGIEPSGDSLPIDYSAELFAETSDSYANRDWAVLQFHWKASELIFQPPYWEDTPLERYGQTASPKLQPVISGAHFFGSFMILPYKIGIDRTHDHISTLGYYRPGSAAPCVRQRLPFEWDAALMEAAAWTGGQFIFP